MGSEFLSFTNWGELYTESQNRTSSHLVNYIVTRLLLGLQQLQKPNILNQAHRFHGLVHYASRFVCSKGRLIATPVRVLKENPLHSHPPSPKVYWQSKASDSAFCLQIPMYCLEPYVYHSKLVFSSHSPCWEKRTGAFRNASECISIWDFSSRVSTLLGSYISATWIVGHPECPTPNEFISLRGLWGTQLEGSFFLIGSCSLLPGLLTPCFLILRAAFFLYRVD